MMIPVTKFKFQYDNTLSLFRINEALDMVKFKFQYDNTLSHFDSPPLKREFFI